METLQPIHLSVKRKRQQAVTLTEYTVKVTAGYIYANRRDHGSQQLQQSWEPPRFSSTTAAAILHLALLLASARRHGATDYTVGDSAGWAIGPNYLIWSQKYNFTAGDTLGTYALYILLAAAGLLSPAV